MNTTITIRENNSKYQVFDGELLLACFGSKTAAEEYGGSIPVRTMHNASSASGQN